MAGKILIIHSGGIGDLLLALPAMRMFRGAFPHDALELLGRTERLSLIAHDLRAESVHSIDQADMAYFFLEGSALPSRLGSFFSSFRAALIFGKKEGAVLKGNLENLGVRTILIPSFPAEASGGHVSDFLVDHLRKAGLQGEKNLSPLELPESSLFFAAEFRASQGWTAGERSLAIHPGSGSPAKNWSLRSFAEVAEWAAPRARILLVLGPAEEGMQGLTGFIREINALVADQLPLVRLAGILKTCWAYVGNDSGITHLAAALGVATITIFGPTDPSVWGPWGPKVTVMCRSDKNAEAISNGDKRHAAGMGEVDPKRVIRAIDKFFRSFPVKITLRRGNHR